MVSTDKIREMVKPAEGYVIIPAADGFPEALTSTDDLAEARSKAAQVADNIQLIGNEVSVIGMMLSQAVRDLDVLRKEGATPGAIAEVREALALATLNLGSVLDPERSKRAAPLPPKGINVALADSLEVIQKLTTPLDEPAE